MRPPETPVCKLAFTELKETVSVLENSSLQKAEPSLPPPQTASSPTKRGGYTSLAKAPFQKQKRACCCLGIEMR